MCTKDVKFSPDGRPLEAALAETLDHPGIVRTVAIAVTGDGPGDAFGQTWLVMELCNGGDLQARVTASSPSLHHLHIACTAPLQEVHGESPPVSPFHTSLSVARARVSCP